MNSPTPSAMAAPERIGGEPLADDGTDQAYWYELIDEKIMAPFMGVTVRTLQKWRQTGEGPKFVALSARCKKYRRIDGRAHAEARLRSSTSDPGPEAATA